MTANESQPRGEQPPVDSKDDELRNKLLDHFTDSAPSYATANEFVQASARRKADELLPLIKQYGLDQQIEEISRLWPLKEGEIHHEIQERLIELKSKETPS